MQSTENYKQNEKTGKQKLIPNVKFTNPFPCQFVQCRCHDRRRRNIVSISLNLPRHCRTASGSNFL